MNLACVAQRRAERSGSAPPAIEVRDLTKRYGAQAPAVLDSLAIIVPHGVIYGILGPNGAGKTTLLSILCGLLKPTAGHVCIDGQDMHATTSRVKQILGVVPQEPAIYPTLSARENLEFFGRMQGLSGARLDERVQACIDLAEIGDQCDRRVEHFSGGYKRRLNLVIGLIHEPRILILDEPTVAIDPHSRSLIHQRLRELHAAGVTILLTTHYMEEAEQLCHQVAIMNRGRIVTQGSVDELLAKQRDDTIVIRLDREPAPELGAALQRLGGVGDCHLSGRCLTATAARPDAAVLVLLRALAEAGIGVESMGFGSASLERVFLSYTAGEGKP